MKSITITLTLTFVRVYYGIAVLVSALLTFFLHDIIQVTKGMSVVAGMVVSVVSAVFIIVLTNNSLNEHNESTKALNELSSVKHSFRDSIVKEKYSIIKSSAFFVIAIIFSCLIISINVNLGLYVKKLNNNEIAIGLLNNTVPFFTFASIFFVMLSILHVLSTNQSITKMKYDIVEFVKKEKAREEYRKIRQNVEFKPLDSNDISLTFQPKV